MNNIFLHLVFFLIITSSYAQSNKLLPLSKHIVSAPDGSLAMTITDDSNKNTIKFESKASFYKYQLIDSETGEPVFSSSNRGKECTFDKSKVNSGTYNLRIFTKNFIITSKITIFSSTSIALFSNDVAIRD